jgi:hypothetical protein
MFADHAHKHRYTARNLAVLYQRFGSRAQVSLRSVEVLAQL